MKGLHLLWGAGHLLPFVTVTPGASGFLWASYRKDKARPRAEPSPQALSEPSLPPGALQVLQRRNCWFHGPLRSPQLGLVFHCHNPCPPPHTAMPQGPVGKSDFLSAILPAWTQRDRIANPQVATQASHRHPLPFFILFLACTVGLETKR